MSSQQESISSEQVAGWRAEISTVLRDCLMEVQSITELLDTVQQPSPIAPPRETRSPPRQHNPQPEPPPADTAILTSSQYEALMAERSEVHKRQQAANRGPIERPLMPASEPANSEEEFDSRLANLKRMLAEKLTNSESQTESSSSERPTHE